MNTQLLFIFITVALWLFIVLYWVASARKEGKDHKATELLGFIKMIGSAAIIYLPLVTGKYLSAQLYSPNMISGVVGCLFCLLGVIVMMRARVNLAHNWSDEVTIQKEHTLTRTGPYKYVRHPIYSGGWLCMFATALVMGYWLGFAWVLFGLISLNLKMNQEEKLLATQFPQEYPEYKKTSKRLIPFVW